MIQDCQACGHVFDAPESGKVFCPNCGNKINHYGLKHPANLPVPLLTV